MSGYFTITVIVATGAEPVIMDNTLQAWGSLEEAIAGVGGKVVLPAPSGDPHEFMILPEDPGSEPPQPWVTSAAVPSPVAADIAVIRKLAGQWIDKFAAQMRGGRDE